jgi:hypothetical protein
LLLWYIRYEVYTLCLHHLSIITRDIYPLMRCQFPPFSRSISDASPIEIHLSHAALEASEDGAIPYS